MFKNIFTCLTHTVQMNWQHFANIRRAKMIENGFEVNHINWEHYAKVLEAKQKELTLS